MPLTKLHAALANLDPRTEVRRGTPATEAEVAHIARETGCELPADYVAFLRELGSLRFITEEAWALHEDLCVLGHAPGDEHLDILLASKQLADEFDRWGQDAEPAAPIITHPEHVSYASECTVLDDEGEVARFRRGVITTRTTSFVDAVIGELEQLAKSLADYDAEEAAAEAADAQPSILDLLLPLLPVALAPRPDEPSGAQRLLLTRPADGVQIELRSGYAGHINDKAPALFVLWRDPSATSAAAINAWNQQAWFVRGSVEKVGARFRGRILGADLDPQLVLHLLAHDAALPVEASVPSAPTLDEVEAALLAAPVYDTFLRVSLEMGNLPPSHAAVARREGADIVFPSLQGKDQPGAIELRARLHASGLVEIRHTAPMRGRLEDVLVAASACNSTRWPESDQFFDSEIFTRVTVQAPAVTLSVTTPIAAIASGDHRIDVLGLAQTVEEATFLGRDEQRTRHHLAVAEATGLTLGPVGSFLVDALQANLITTSALPGERSASSPRPPASEWGVFQPFLATTEHSASPSWRAQQRVEVGWGAAPGRSTDDAPILGYHRAGEVRLLAANLRDWLSAYLVTAVGYDFHGDADRAWRNHRARAADVGTFFRFVEDARVATGIEPAVDPNRVLSRARPAPQPPGETARSFEATPQGEATLAEVDALILASWKVQSLAASHPDKESVHQRMKAIEPEQAVAAVETWIARRRASLEVRCGEPVEKPDAALHPLHRALLGRFGWLEVRIAADPWPHRRHSDGLRILGDVPGYRDCDLGWQRQELERALSLDDGFGEHLGKDRDKVATLAPFMTTLEGMALGWAAGERACIPVESVSTSFAEAPHDFRDVTHPRLGPPFALLARLMLIDRRIDELAEWRAVAELLSTVGPSWVDGRGRLRLRDDARVSVALEGYRQQLARVPAATRVLVTCEALRGPSHAGYTPPDAALEKRIADLAPRLRAATLRLEETDVVAEAFVVREGISAGDLQLAVAAVRHAAAQLASPELPPFGDEAVSRA